MPLYKMDPLEIAGGWLHGHDSEPLPPHHQADDPRQALEQILRPHLSRSPCMVAFSGGRDSSVLLAAAAATARREGLPLPVPITLSYPAAPETDEAGWQRRVLDHLGITERVVLVVDDEHDPLGPVATPVLRRHGVVWPPNIAPTVRMLDQARGGVLLTGESGDEIFGISRVTPVTNVLATRGRVSRSMYVHAALALAPAGVRRRVAMRDGYRRSWLREPVEALLARRDADEFAAEPLHAGRSARRCATRRAVRRGYDTMRILGIELGADYLQTFGEPAFVAAMAAAAGRWGWTGRTATMRRLFGDLLPREVLERRTKANFTHAVFTTHTRAFARRWTGSGVDQELVDHEALQKNWLSDFPHAPTMALLQQAWLASSVTTGT